MSDFSLDVEIDACVDAAGDADKTQRWIFKNLCARPLDLTGWTMYFNLTCPHIRITGAHDSLGRQLQTDRSPQPEGLLRVSCDFDRVLEVGETYKIEVDYHQPGYVRRLPESGYWLLDEWFTRQAKLNCEPYVQQEPETWSLTLHTPDVRSSFLWIKDPTKFVEIKTLCNGAAECRLAKDSVRWDMSLKLEDRATVHVLYYPKLRSRIMGALLWGSGVAVGAVAVELLRILVFEKLL
jgi:hypothetical protein